MHLDIRVRDADQAEQELLALGATRVPAERETGFRVFTDPVGHPLLHRFRSPQHGGWDLMTPAVPGGASPETGQGVIAIEVGSDPTGIALPALLVAVEIGVTVLEVALAT